MENVDIITIMKFNKNPDVIITTYFNGGKNSMKERIRILEHQSNHKRYILVFLSILVVLISAQLLVGCSKINDSNETTRVDNNIEQEMEYINESLGYAITLPKNVIDRVIIEKNNDTVYIASKMITESDSGFQGIILFINSIPKSEYPIRQELDNYIKNESPVPLFVIGETENAYICYTTATDVQYPPDDEAMTKEYNDLTNEFINYDFKFRVLN